jgi:hypothetical protein
MFQSATVVLGLVFISGLSACFGDITYNMVNDPVDQNGYNLSGTIVSDGTIGALTGIDILSWEFTITGHGGTFQATSPPFPGGGVGITDVTATNIALQVSGFLTLFDFGTGDGLQWDPAGSLYVGEATRQDIWVTSGQGFGSSPWTVATVSGVTVPEPSSAVLAAVTSACGLAYGWCRSRRKRRPQRPLEMN